MKTIEATDNGSILHLTDHAWCRMGCRSLSAAEIQNAIDYGREYYSHGAQVFVIGRKEIEKYKKNGINLIDLEGLRVVYSTDGVIITAYKNKDLGNIRRVTKHGRSVRQVA